MKRLFMTPDWRVVPAMPPVQNRRRRSEYAPDDRKTYPYLLVSSHIDSYTQPCAGVILLPVSSCRKRLIASFQEAMHLAFGMGSSCAASVATRSIAS